MLFYEFARSMLCYISDGKLEEHVLSFSALVEEIRPYKI